ncbi:hypothetical protein [Sphingomonas sp. PP-F2F-G114-C0414]|uniref:hypothetical protein n=1 Tax=Sphingomonas sp. PP-F2F-G114-C0414 TaxID=2135662 RepID=UPI0011C459AB|nr:hypothetical protein [Sphingomonas sp. PP-F2F-G114-C0414]
MPDIDRLAAKSALREAMARNAYARGEVRIADPDLTEQTWLVASHRGLFAISADGGPGTGVETASVKTIVYGWFFGLCRHHDVLYVFENCGHRDRTIPMGRIVRFDLAGDRLATPEVIVIGLHTNCHQIAVIDGLLCVLDTANQAILRFTLDGNAVDVQRPFAAAPPYDTSGAYLHINAIAAVGDRTAIMLHNGKAIPAKTSELAWLDRDWRVIERQPLPGYSCHDIVADERGMLWHCDSMAGDIMAADGTRAHVTDTLMTRGLAITRNAIIVGMSSFGPRHLRSKLHGGVVILDRALELRMTMILDGSPTDIIAL